MFLRLSRGCSLVILAVLSYLQAQGYAQTGMSLPSDEQQRPTLPQKEASTAEPESQAADPAADELRLRPRPIPPSVPDTLPDEKRPSNLPGAAPASEAGLTSEFQKFVANSVGRKLPIYGYSLFERVPTTFSPLDRVPVTADYLIGPGDELLIRAWGQIDLDCRLVVDREGEVFLPKVGALQVAGLTHAQLSSYIRTAVGRVFRNFDLTVTLGRLRSIQVFVVGQARRPGSYTVSSLSTLVNALFASGGPSATGSMRRIQLKRDDAVVTELDLYDLLLKGDKSKDARLLPGDVIYIPPVGPSLAVAGSVNVPAIYELRDEITLAAGVEMAGGLATTANGQKAVVERIEGRGTRRVEEFPLDKQGWERPLKDGDLVRIFCISPRFENAVTLRGNVAHPGRAQWHTGMRLRDLIPDRDALVTRDYWNTSNAGANSEMASNITMNADMQANEHGRKIDLARSQEGQSEFDITRAASEINWDYAVIQRLDAQDLSARLIPFDLGKLVLQGDEQSNLVLEPGDTVIVFSQRDVQVPLEKRSVFVRLEGEFRSAGVYRAEAGESLRHLVERVGDLTANSYLYGAEFTRESERIRQQKGLDELSEKLEYEISEGALSTTRLTSEEAAEGREKVETQRQLLATLRQLKATGRITLNLKPNARTADDLPDIPLENGDRLLVPSCPSTIAVLGAVYNKNSFLYRRRGQVGDYLREAGGPTRDADRSRMYLIRADGSVLSRQSLGGFWNGGFVSLPLRPGDAIVVPQRLSRGSFLRGLRDWSQILSQFALGAAAVRVIQ